MQPIKTTNANGDPVYAYVIRDTEIHDPTVSDCGRFTVDPFEEYGLSPDQVKALIDLNNSHGYQWGI